MFEGPGDARAALAAAIVGLRGLDQDVDDAVRVDRLRLLEELKSAASAAQAREAVAFAASQKAQQLAAGVRADRAERGIAEQVGLAVRRSPWNAHRYLGWARILTTELPRTLEELWAGRTTERRAMIVARETMFLSREDRAAVDEEIAPKLEDFGDKQVEGETKTLAYRADPAGYVERVRGAAKDRCVTVRPAPDVMSRISGFVPVAQGVACYASLRKEADRLIAAGDERGRGQIMADTMVTRLTGQATAEAVPIEVNLVMTDRALFAPRSDGGGEPGLLEDVPVPAEIARALVLDAADETPIWLRRLYASPATGQLVAMDSTRRLFAGQQRRFVQLRDRTCRTPWCDAPIRHIDHVQPSDAGGGTVVDNAQGYCAACNYAKQAPGWRNTVTTGDGPHEVEITTPTGHTYRSRAPDPPRAA